MVSSAALAYYTPVLFLFIPWLLFFLIRPDLRKKMIILSITGSVTGPVSQFWYLKDYWQPFKIFTPEGLFIDILFAAFIFSLTCVIYNLFFKMKSISIKKVPKTYFIYRSLIGVIILIGSLVIFTDIIGVNSIYSSAIGFLILTSIIWFERHDLVKISIIGAIFFMIFTFIGYRIILTIWPNFIQEIWLLKNISGILIFGIPLEEFIWFSTWGLVGISLYEWVYSYKFKKIS